MKEKQTEDKKIIATINVNRLSKGAFTINLR